MHTYALIDPNGIAENVILWDGTSAYAAPTGYTLIQIDGLSPMPGIGWTLSGTTWTAPTPLPPTPDLAGFSNSLTGSTVLTNSEKGYLVGWLAGLAISLEDGDLVTIENGWTAIKNGGQVSSTSLSAIAAAANQYNIPGIT